MYTQLLLSLISLEHEMYIVGSIGEGGKMTLFMESSTQGEAFVPSDCFSDMLSMLCKYYDRSSSLE